MEDRYLLSKQFEIYTMAYAYSLYPEGGFFSHTNAHFIATKARFLNHWWVGWGFFSPFHRDCNYRPKGKSYSHGGKKASYIGAREQKDWVL